MQLDLVHPFSLDQFGTEIMRRRGLREESLFYPWQCRFLRGSVGRLNKADVEKWKQMEGMII